MTTAALLDAIEFAARKHRDQRRKDAAASPYINHPISLAYLLSKEGGVNDVEILQAALLHDTIEDTDTTAGEITIRFGAAVTNLVLEVTDDKSLSKADRKRLQIEHASKKSAGAALVKLADKTCNLRDIAATPPVDWSIERRCEYFDWAKAVVDRLPRVNTPLLDAFDEAYKLRPRN